VGAVLLALAAYGSSLANPFMLDDRVVIAGDPRVTSADWEALLSREYWPGPRGNGLYRPLASLSFALNWIVSPAPAAFRAVNIALHAAAAWLVAVLAWRWFGRRSLALVAGLLFLLHPVHSSCIQQVVDRAEIGAALFGLLALVLVAPRRTATEASGGRSFGRSVAMAIGAPLCFAAALGFKESAATILPIAVFAHFALPRPDAGVPQRSAPEAGLLFAPWVLVLVFVLVMRLLVVGTVARDPAEVALVDNPLAALDELGLTPQEQVLARWATPVAVFARGLALLVWPHPLSWDYSYAAVDVVRSLADAWLWAGVAVLALLATVFAVSWRRRRILALCIGFLLLATFVTSNTLLVIGTLFAERFLYLPSVGFCTGIAAVAVALWDRAGGRGRVSFSAAGVALLALMIAANVARTRDWRSTEGLNAADLASQPRSARLWCSVAVDRLNAGDAEGAVTHAERAIAICPSYSTAWRIAGLADARRGQRDRAIARLRRAIELGDGDHEQAGVTLASLLKERGDYAAAIAELVVLTRKRPDAATAHNNLAWYLVTAEPPELRDLKAALVYAREAVRLAPERGDALDTLVAVLDALGRPDAADEEIRARLPKVAADDPFRAALEQRLRKAPP